MYTHIYSSSGSPNTKTETLKKTTFIHRFCHMTGSVISAWFCTLYPSFFILKNQNIYSNYCYSTNLQGNLSGELKIKIKTIKDLFIFSYFFSSVFKCNAPYVLF